MNFRSDNILGCPPAILEAMARVNATATHPYGNDPVTAGLGPVVSALFEHEAFVFPVSSGTAANGLALAAVTPPYGTVFCHRVAHIRQEEWCSPEFFTGGARLVGVDGADAKMAPAALAHEIALAKNAGQPSTVSLTQTTEAGTLYTLDELGALVAVAKAHGLGVHMDGARFANALVALGCTPAELTWRLGVDSLAFGATKNGTLTAEAVIVFRKDLADLVMHRRKRAGQVSSKMRFLSAQLDAYLTDGLWLANARAANTAGQRLAAGLVAMGIGLAAPAQANLVFPKFAPALTEALRAAGYEFLDWPWLGDGVVRFVCGFSTPLADVDQLLETIKRCQP